MVLALFVLLTAISTVYDVLCHKTKTVPKIVLSSFSLQKNFKDLRKVNTSNTTINCIDAIKVLSAVWIIIGHRSDLLKEPFPQHYQTGKPWWEELVLRFIASYSNCNESFFACSSILVTLSLLRSYDR